MINIDIKKKDQNQRHFLLLAFFLQSERICDSCGGFSDKKIPQVYKIHLSGLVMYVRQEKTEVRKTILNFIIYIIKTW